MPSYSVVIPCYCDGIFAIQAIESCLQQSEAFVEIIFVDDGSPDDSYEMVADKFAGVANVHCYRLENGGVSKARNFGFGKSTGEWVVFLDADDLLAGDYLKDATKHINREKSKSESVVVMPFCYFGKPESDRAKWVRKYRPPMLGESRSLNLLKLSVTNCFPVSSAIVPRSLQKNGKIFNEDLTHYEDWELWLKLAKQGAIFDYSPPSINSATLIRLRDGVSSNSIGMLTARKSIAEQYFKETVMAIWQVPIVGDWLRKLFVGFWRVILRKSLSHPNLTSSR
jgi:glycosyltransferase involved in cell wall biosynthesis